MRDLCGDYGTAVRSRLGIDFPAREINCDGAQLARFRGPEGRTRSKEAGAQPAFAIQRRVACKLT